jgi:CelD/BcsL family acetyltransferase involved in cellulose biosynthesis
MATAARDPRSHVPASATVGLTLFYASAARMSLMQPVPRQQITAARTGPCPVEIEVAARLDFMGEPYRQLHARSAATAFQHPLWLEAFYRGLAPARGAEPVIVTGRKAGSGELVFVLPMIRRLLSGVALLESADLGVGDYAAPVVAEDWTKPADLVSAIAPLLPAYDLLRIRPVRQEAVAQWRRFFDAPATRLDFSAHETRLGLPYQAWRETAFERSFIKYLERRRRRFFKAGEARLQRLMHEDEIAEAMSALRELRTGRFEGDPIEDDATFAFYRHVAVTGVREDFSRVYALYLDGERVGIVFGLTHAGRFLYLLIGCDYPRHGRYSPGLVLYDGIMKEWAESGGAIFDFTIGDEPFKKDFATVPVAMFRIMHCPTLRGRLAMLALEARARLKKLKSGPFRASHNNGSLSGGDEQ